MKTVLGCGHAFTHHDFEGITGPLQQIIDRRFLIGPKPAEDVSRDIAMIRSPDTEAKALELRAPKAGDDVS